MLLDGTYLSSLQLSGELYLIGWMKGLTEMILQIVAVFIGRDGSMGFRTGKEYKLWFFEKNGMYYISRRSENAVAIPYATMNAVNKNWTIVEETNER